MIRLAATPIDDFLRTDPGGLADRLQRIGVVLGAVGTTLAVGVIVFVAVVHRGRASLAPLVRVAALGGALACLGGAIELAGVAARFDIGWIDAVGDHFGRSATMRLVGGALVVVGLARSMRSRSAAPASGPHARATEPDLSRWVPDATAVLAFVGAAVAVLSFAFDGHTVTRGPRAVHAVVDAVHVTAGGIWFGGLVSLALLVRLHRPAGDVLAALHRFSLLATASLATVAVAGLVMAVFVLDDVGQLTGTPWGRYLLIKVALVAVAAAFGGYHHYAVLPRSAVGRVRTTITLEAVVLVAVAVVSGLLSVSSTV